MWSRCLLLDTVIDGSNPGCIRHLIRIASVNLAEKSVADGSTT